MKVFPNLENPFLPRDHELCLFVKSGEFRCPKKGEYFLSGAIPGAYQAPNDLSNPYHIAKPFKDRRVKERREH
jgi:hypothetical protein